KERQASPDADSIQPLDSNPDSSASSAVLSNGNPQSECMAKSKILIVEDEASLAEVLTYNLQREGYEVVVAREGREGLRKGQMLQPDLVILDLMLPGMNGLDICRELRASSHTAQVPILMLTAKAEETDQVVGFAVGADDYVTKPFSVKVLLQRIKVL